MPREEPAITPPLAAISKLPPRIKTILDTKVSAPALHHGMENAAKQPASVGAVDKFRPHHFGSNAV